MENNYNPLIIMALDLKKISKCYLIRASLYHRGLSRVGMIQWTSDSKLPPLLVGKLSFSVLR